MRKIKGALAVLFVGFVIIIAITAATSSGSSKPHTAAAHPTRGKHHRKAAGDQKARDYIKSHAGDLTNTQHAVQNAELGLGLVALDLKKNRDPSADVANAAQAAQDAHDRLDQIRNDFALNSDSDTSTARGNAELEVFSAANDLKNAMGQMVAVLSSNTLGSAVKFKSQYVQAADEWNAGVKTLYRLAHRRGAPTVDVTS